MESLCVQLGEGLLYANRYDLKSKLCLYFHNSPKIELEYRRELEGVERNFLGSEIRDAHASVLFVAPSRSAMVYSYLEGLAAKGKALGERKDMGQMLDELIHKFIYDFESCSTMHARSDAYQYYYFYNIALHTLVQIKHLDYGSSSYNFLPKRFHVRNLAKGDGVDEQSEFFSLHASFDLPQANGKKRDLLDSFYRTIHARISSEQEQEVRMVCEAIYERDYYWNFRDISKYNPRFTSGQVFRSSALSLIPETERQVQLLESKGIGTIIDLRAQEKEIDRVGRYAPQLLERVNYVHVPLDVWNQPEWFKENYHHGAHIEIAYRFFALGCKAAIRRVMETLLSAEDGVVIHCFAGKDRTGFIISLLSLLVGSPRGEVFMDYLASEYDVETGYLDICLQEVELEGGITPYLQSCDLTLGQIEALREKLKA